MKRKDNSYDDDDVVVVAYHNERIYLSIYIVMLMFIFK